MALTWLTTLILSDVSRCTTSIADSVLQRLVVRRGLICEVLDYITYLTCGNFLARHTARGMTSSATEARNNYLAEVQATTEKAPVLKRLVRFAKLLHRLTHHDQQ